MAVAAAPAPPTLAAARSRVAHERPMAAPRDRLAPTHRHQPPARSREAPILHMQLCTCPSWAYSHAHHSAHCLAARAHVGAAAGQQRQQRQQQQQHGWRRRQRHRQQQHQWQLAMASVAAFNSGNSAAIAAASSVFTPHAARTPLSQCTPTRGTHPQRSRGRQQRQQQLSERLQSGGSFTWVGSRIDAQRRVHYNVA